MIRPYRADDADAVLDLNAANVPEVGPLDNTKFELLVEISPYFRVVDTDDGIVGFLIGLTHDSTAYASPNYRWFSTNYDRFAYIDRVALASEARGQGWGPKLYEGFAEWAEDQSLPRLCAEVNTEPPNERSSRFHKLFGFTEVGRLRPYGPDEEVEMLEMPLP